MIRDKLTDDSYYCFHTIASENNCNNLNGFKFGLDAGGNRLSEYKFDDDSNNKSSNQSSSSGSSSQSNKKANRQSANNQSSSSSTSDLSKMNRDQLFTTINAAINSKDWVKAYTGLQKLSKDQDPEISRQAIRKMGEYLYLGQGVKQNLGEADRLFEQASSMGDLDAYGHLCGTY